MSVPVGYGELLTKKSNGYYKGCGCGMKTQDLVVVPDNSVELSVQLNGDHVGPKSGLKYHFQPNTTSIDIDNADGVQWKKDKIAFEPHVGQKGRLARVYE